MQLYFTGLTNKLTAKYIEAHYVCCKIHKHTFCANRHYLLRLTAFAEFYIRADTDEFFHYPFEKGELATFLVFMTIFPEQAVQHAEK